VNGFYFDFVSASRAAPGRPPDTEARRAGLLYEKKITSIVEANSKFCISQLPICSLRSHQQVARPDILIFDQAGVLCIEVKKSFNNDCFSQIIRYRSLLLSMDIGAVRVLAICEAFSGRESLRYTCGVQALVDLLHIALPVEVCIVSARELRKASEASLSEASLEAIGGNLGCSVEASSSARADGNSVGNGSGISSH